MNLIFFLSDRCNMVCDYCFLDLNGPASTVLDAAAAKKAADDHLSRGKYSQFTFLGGEPLLHFSLLKEVASHIRSAGGAESRIRVVTNGTLLTGERLLELEGLGVEVIVSLDGTSAAHDRHRPMRGGRPSFDKALAALPSAAHGRVSVNMVVSGDTAAELLSGMESLRTAGFSRIAFHPHVTAPWAEEDLAVFKKSLEGFVRYASVLPGLALPILDALTGAGPDLSGSGPEHSYEDIVLGADGRYYPCDGLFSRPYHELKEWAVGDAVSGLDASARETAHAHARERIHGFLGGASHFNCPRETYFQAMATGQDPSSAVRAFHRVDTLIGETLSPLAAKRRPETYAA